MSAALNTAVEALRDLDFEPVEEIWLLVVGRRAMPADGFLGGIVEIYQLAGEPEAGRDVSGSDIVDIIWHIDSHLYPLRIAEVKAAIRAIGYELDTIRGAYQTTPGFRFDVRPAVRNR